jgi:hypothetical protein
MNQMNAPSNSNHSGQYLFNNKKFMNSKRDRSGGDNSEDTRGDNLTSAITANVGGVGGASSNNFNNTQNLNTN